MMSGFLREELKDIRDALKNDINEYAKTNPQFGEKWHAAEKLHSEMATREELNRLLKLKEHLHPEMTFEPKKLAEDYLNVRNDKYFVRLIGGEKNLKHWDDIVTSAAALPHTKVSTLAKNMKIMALLGTSATAAGNFLNRGCQ